MRVRCIAPYTAVYINFPYSGLYINSTVRARHMSMAAASLTLSELQQKLHIKLASTSEFSDYPPGHEAMICLVHAGSSRCVGCPPPINGSGTRPCGPAFCDVLKHVVSQRHFGGRQGQAQAAFTAAAAPLRAARRARASVVPPCCRASQRSRRTWVRRGSRRV